MQYSDDERDDEGDDLRSETLSPSEAGPSEPVAGKRQRLRQVLLPAIQSRVTALGGYENITVRTQRDEDAESSDAEEEEEGAGQEQTIRVYKLGDEALGCLKDLKRFWRMDDNDDERTIGRMFYETGVLKNDLIPILNCAGQPDPSTRQEKAALASADLIAAMTWPINVLEELREAELSAGGDKKAIEQAQKIDYSSLLAAQRSYKSAILKSGAIKTLFKMLVPRMEKGMRDRTDRDENIISLILHIWRNLAAIKDRTLSTYHSADSIEEANLQSELICQLASENVFDLLITIASLSNKTEFNQWNMVILEIFYLLFRGVERPDLLIKKSDDVTKVLREEKLGKLLDAEASRKRMDARRGVTRHSRFGTTVVIEQGKDRIVMHKQASVASASTNPGKVIDQAKKKRATKVRESNDLAPPAELRPEAIKVLQAVAMSFLESAFNPFFGSVLRDIRMERAKVREIDNIRFLFLVRLFLEYFLGLREYEVVKGVDPKSEDGHDFDLVAEFTEPSSIVYVCLRMKLTLDEKPPLWTELHASVECFVQLLLVMDALYYSGNEEYKEVSEILQNKLYYEPETLEMVLKVITTYKDQPIKYLDAIVHLAYVMLRMLEKYSKNRDYMFVRKKAARKGKKSKKGAEDDPLMSEEDEEAEYEGAGESYSEHKFAFNAFEARFAGESVVKTLVSYLGLYKDFTDENQMKRIVGLLHRVAVKTHGEGMFFRATTLELFRRILDDQACLPRTGPYKDLMKLLGYILKTFFKLAQTNSLLFLEAFFPHTKTEMRREILQEKLSDEEDDGPKPMRMPAEIKVKKGHSWSEEMGIAITLLSEMNRDDLISWVKDTLSSLAKSREAVIYEIDKDRLAQLEEQGAGSDEDEDAFARRKMLLAMAGPSKDALAALTDHEIVYEDEDTQDACTRNSQLKLLLRLIKWESRESDEKTHLIWTVPASLPPSDLLSYIKIIDQYLLEPFRPEGEEQAIEDLVTKKAKPRKLRRVRSESPAKSDNNDDDDVIFSDPDIAAAVRGPGRKSSKESGKSKGGRGKGGASGEGGAGAARRKKRIEEAKAYRTAEFIVDSDDDDDTSKAFFEREAALRREMEARSGKGNGVVEKLNKKEKKKAKGKGKKETAAGGKKGKGRASTEEVEISERDSDRENADPGASGVPASDSEQSDSPARAPLKTATKGRPRPRPAVKERVDVREDDEQDGVDSSPANTSNPLKRSRNVISDAESGDEAGSSPKMTATAASKKGRRVVDSDDED